MLKGMFHTGFVVRDLERAIDFYTGTLGLNLVGRTERQGDFASKLLAFPEAHIRGAFLELGDGHQLELIQYVNPPGGEGQVRRNDAGAAHLAFFVADLDAFYAEKAGRGLIFNSDPAALYAEDGQLLRKALYAQDPEGNWLEFVELF